MNAKPGYFLNACIASLLILAPGCTDRNRNKAPKREPTTFYGKTIHKTKQLSKTFDKKNEEVKKQARKIFDSE